LFEVKYLSTTQANAKKRAKVVFLKDMGIVEFQVEKDLQNFAKGSLFHTNDS